MSEQIPASMIHPLAPEFLSVAALYSAPIDVEAAVARLKALWNVEVAPVWDEVPAGSAGPGSPAGRILHYTQDGIVVMMTPVPGAMQVERGALPPHTFHVAITCFVPPTDEDGASSSSNQPVPSFDDEAAKRRAGMVRAHTVLTQLLDSLMREDAAVGVFRQEFGVVQPPQMVTELADSLAHGQAPLPLWVAVRTFRPDLAHGRTFGLPLFGHLDMEIVDSTKSDEELYTLLVATADYIIASGAQLMPGQTVGFREGEHLPLAQATSPTDGSPVLRIQF
ncbi:DUF4261 domain-containing protein [Arcanobacterium haemolyticum]|nr:DUF4261 domain-containing protein [Arcanobacterium haemolyticum]